MEFEFDERKSSSNKEKHGIDFVEARKLWSDIDRIIIPTKFVEEQRYMLIGQIDEKFWSTIYTYRRGNVRLISARRAIENEKNIYKS